MRWGKWIGVACLALAVLAPAGTAAAEPAPGGTFAFQLQGTHGFSILVLAGWNPRVPNGSVVVFADRPGESAFYGAPASVDPEGIEADLGALGRISLRRLPLGHEETAHSVCAKKPVHFEAQALVGEVEFEGEEGYTTARATRVKSLVKPLLDLVCPGYGFSVSSGPGLPGAEIDAHNHGASPVQVKADTNGPRHRVKITASISETAGQMQIERSVSRIFPSMAFEYEPQLGKATLAPPSPFSGRGVFRRSAAPVNRWTGNLAVDFPGRSHVPLTGSGFGAGLRHVHWSEEYIHHADRQSLSLSAWPSTKPWPTAFARSSPLDPSRASGGCSAASPSWSPGTCAAG